MSDRFDYLVYIGRFQPFHRGHLAIVERALQCAQNLIICLGSAHQPPSLRNPFDINAREQMIRAALPQAAQARLHFVPIMDAPYNEEAWVAQVQAAVSGLTHSNHNSPRIGLIGHHKDATSYYLNLFPRWESVAVNNVAGICATPLRNELLSDIRAALTGPMSSWLPPAVADYLAGFAQSDTYRQLRAEAQFIEKYKSGWASAPYAPTFVTVDAVVVQSGHVLLVERKSNPGAGLYALPGGFVNPAESLLDACLRELREETRLKVPAPVLKGSIKRSQVFDAPYRSARGRTITQAFYIELEPASSLPKVRGADDARLAFWQPLGELDSMRMFEDHYFIIQAMAGLSN